MEETYRKQNIRKVGQNMSFVGMHITNEGIIAFADSKGTIEYESGYKQEDVNRGPIQKIFKNNHFILVTHGNNEIFSSKVHLEDYLNKKVKDGVNVNEFLNQFYNDLIHDKPDYNDGFYRFIIGTKNDKNMYCIYDIVIHIHDSTIYLPKPQSSGYIIGGNKRYMDIYQAHQFYHHIDIKEYSQHIKSVVENMIQLEDCFTQYEYNPAGLPIQIEIFQ